MMWKRRPQGRRFLCPDLEAFSFFGVVPQIPVTAHKDGAMTPQFRISVELAALPRRSRCARAVSYRIAVWTCTRNDMMRLAVGCVLPIRFELLQS
jgi:hypothetical protein